MGLQVVKETEYGVYVWKMPDGRIVADEEGHWMCIASKEGDIRKVQALQDAARSYGIEEGTPLFVEGARKVTDEEYAEQVERMESGLIPDEYDAAAWAEEIKNARRDK